MVLTAGITYLALASLGSANPARGDEQVASADHPKIHRSVYDRMIEPGSNGTVRAWVLFKGKGLETPAIRADAVERRRRIADPRSLERRRVRRTRPGLFDIDDVPVSAAYVNSVRATGARLHVVSDWINAVSVTATKTQLERIAGLEFVEKVQPVRRGGVPEPQAATATAGPIDPATAGTGFYGLSFDQLEQIKLTDVHSRGFTGQGVRIGILDTGFARTHAAFNQASHPLIIIAEHDFVSGDGNTAPQAGDPSTQHSHGTNVLGTLGAYLPGQLVGGAFDAEYILCKTEDVTNEYPAEEDNFVAGLQFIEARGADVVTSSLGYLDWYQQSDFDGMTAVTTIAINIATANGVHCVNAAGNYGHDSNPATSHTFAPADAFQVITVGAIDSAGTIAGFSSDGPTSDGRVKPELLARGAPAWTVSATNNTDFQSVNGTSFAAPLVAGLVGCLVQAHPNWSVDQMRWYLFHTASDYAIMHHPDPLFVRGYGIADGFAALAADCNHNGAPDSADIAGGISRDCNNSGVPDECELAVDPTLDENGNGTIDSCEQPNIPALSTASCVIMSAALIAVGWMVLRRRAVSSV